jgi:hypothetical protein
MMFNENYEERKMKQVINLMFPYSPSFFRWKKLGSVLHKAH